jgi:hypothetical protein
MQPERKHDNQGNMRIQLIYPNLLCLWHVSDYEFQKISWCIFQTNVQQDISKIGKLCSSKDKTNNILILEKALYNITLYC